jgi:DNA primase
MSSAAVPPVVETKIATLAVPVAPGIVSAYLKAHERLIIVVLFFGLLGWGIQKWDNHAAAAADTRATIADAHAATTDKTAAQSLAILQQALAEKNATNQMLAQQNAALAAAITSRQSAVVVQQKTDSSLAPSALATHIAALSGVVPAEVVFDGVNIDLSKNAALAVAQSLEVVPELQANLQDETTIAKNTQTELDGANSLVVTQGTAITALNSARAADAAACDADKKKITADARKQNMKWFRRGIFVGFFGGLYAHTLGL